MRFSLFLSIVILGCGAFSSLDAATLHAIVICDTQAENIEESVLADFDRVRYEISNIARITGMKEEILSFSGKEVDKSLILHLKWLNVGADDLLFFYFSGHGYRTPSKSENRWPNLFLTSARRGIDFLEVVNLLKEKKPRLLIAIADCCNNVIADAWAPPLISTKRHALMMKAPDIKRNYCRLFLEQKGAIVISGSIPGQQSWGNEKGGCSTTAFFASLKEESETFFEPNWGVLLDRASLSVIQSEIGQTPQYALENIAP